MVCICRTDCNPPVDISARNVLRQLHSAYRDCRVDIAYTELDAFGPLQLARVQRRVTDNQLDSRKTCRAGGLGAGAPQSTK